MLPNNKFEGVLNGKNISDFINQLDFTIENTTERVEKVREILYTQGIDKNCIDEYFEMFFDQSRTPKAYFDVNIGTTGYTSEFNNVCKQLEHMANYILYNKEAQEENDESEYPYLTNTDKRKVKKKELSYEQIFEKKENANEVQIQNKEVNRLGIKKYPKMSILKEDVEEIDYIKQLQHTIDNLLLELNNEEIDESEKFNLRRTITDLRKEQIVIKNGIRKPIEFKKIMNEETVLDFDSDTGYYDKDENYTLISENRIDLFNPNHIYNLIERYCQLKENSYEGLNSDIKYILWVLEDLIDNTDLEEYERDIILWKIDGMIGKNILEKLNIKYRLEWSEPYLTKAYKNLCKKISEHVKVKYEDWFYLYKAKGNYKTCSKCGEVKLANKHYFSKNKSSKDGLHSVCKSCKK